MIVKSECPSCGEIACEVWKDQDVLYGQPPVTIIAHCPVIECTSCKGEFTDWRSERIRKAVVNAYRQGVDKSAATSAA